MSNTDIFRVPVKVRHEMTMYPAWQLGFVPIDQLDQLIESLSKWGFFDGEIVHTQIVGQYVGETRGGPESYFEIVLMGE